MDGGLGRRGDNAEPIHYGVWRQEISSTDLMNCPWSGSGRTIGGGREDVTAPYCWQGQWIPMLPS